MFKLFPEQWTLFAIFLVFGGLAAWFGIDLATNTEVGNLPASQKYTPPDLAIYDGVEEAFQHNIMWEDPNPEHALFISRQIAYFPANAENKAFQPFDLQLEDPNGIPLQWYKDNGFPLDNPEIAFEDPDDDGFTTLDEFNGNTDPNDQKSHPDIMSKLYVQDIEFIPLKLMLRGHSNNVYQINRTDVPPGERSSFLKRQGDMILHFKVDAFRKIINEVKDPTTGVITTLDLSELDLIDTQIEHKKEIVTLVMNQLKDSGKGTVTFYLDVPFAVPEPAQVKRGSKFKVLGREFRLEKAIRDSMSAEIVELIDGKAEKTFSIPKIDKPIPPAPTEEAAESDETLE